MATLYSLVRICRSLRPAVAVWGSPKVGLLGSLAGRLTGVPSVYVVHGLRFETTTGLEKRVLKLLEGVAIYFSNSTVAVGHQVRDVLIAERLAPAGKIVVLADGSANGVKVQDTPQSEDNEELVFGFVGRLAEDKGLRELIEAWELAYSVNPSLRLSVYGDAENDAVSLSLASTLRMLPGVTCHGYLDDADSIYGGMSVLLLPSYREGLPNVVLEAAARCIPAIVSDATGAGEPVLAGSTGLIVPARDATALAHAILELAEDGRARSSMGMAARQHVLEKYGRDRLWATWRAYLSAMAR